MANNLIPVELDQLIQEYLTDGVLTDKERQVILRKAERMGLDRDEIDLYLDAQVQKIDQAVEEAARKNKHGDIKECPKCGAPVSGIEAKCSACGYEFHGLEANKSAQKLAEKLTAITSNNPPNRESLQADVITSFPVPTTKEDLMEFLISMTSKEKLLGHFYPERTLKEAYRAKMSECITKARINFSNDPTMQQIVAEAQAALDVPLKHIGKTILKVLSVPAAILIIMGIIAWIFDL